MKWIELAQDRDRQWRALV